MIMIECWVHACLLVSYKVHIVMCVIMTVINFFGGHLLTPRHIQQKNNTSCESVVSN